MKRRIGSQSRHPRPGRTKRAGARSLVAGATIVGLVIGCGGPAGSPARPTSSPNPTVSPAWEVASQGPAARSPSAPGGTPSPRAQVDVIAFDAAARAFVDRFNADWADAPAAFAAFTPGAVIIDPTNMDYTIGPGPDIVEAWGSFAQAVPDYRATTTSAYVSDTGAAFATEVAGLPVGLPDGLLHELRVFRFTDRTASSATAMELWYELGDRLVDTDNTRLDCVAPDHCADDVTALAESYLAAWTSGDAGRIAQLYHPDATFTDGARGTRATGATEIGDLTRTRFGGGTPSCEARDLYVQADGADPRSSDNADPKGGSIAGIAIVHRCEFGTSAGQLSVDGLSLLLFGHRQAHSFDNDPHGRIVVDETFYDAASLSAAGLVP